MKKLRGPLKERIQQREKQSSKFLQRSAAIIIVLCAALLVGLKIVASRFLPGNDGENTSLIWVSETPENELPPPPPPNPDLLFPREEGQPVNAPKGPLPEFEEEDPAPTQVRNNTPELETKAPDDLPMTEGEGNNINPGE